MKPREIPSIAVAEAIAEPVDAGRHRAVASGVVVVLLGAFLLLGTGLAQPNLLHEAAHDTRHGFAFPCH